eukprot:CAMPEP_0116019478 /NCGR_PEP_ID=MMETSP0321-20121206/9262_1 /TAXON_ID=163516 /ORGANISM="Leptocylindrus danicus var. danicus, Strain B650" /LENGTH=162 /DNA_ID=CAMNT_0003490059 /DNA_START=1 /DNA_END=489 /DNA_ORIENTATION=+
MFLLFATAAPSISEERQAARPLYLRPVFEFYGFEIQPATIIITLLGAYLMYLTFFKTAKAEASHILVKDMSDETKKKLEELKKEIGTDRAKFGEAAKKMSECPSGASQGGYLGRFGKGTMVPPFEKCLWDESNPIGQIAGPVLTNFGYHLIFIHGREKGFFE